MENLEKKIAAVEYNPDRFVKELSRTRVGGAELQLAATTIRELADHYSRTLKKSVYHNHLHFRDTAQQVSLLEMDMSDLSHLLTEHALLLHHLAAPRSPARLQNRTPATHQEQDEAVANEKRKMKLNAIFEKVENCISLTDHPDREVLHEGDLLELDGEDGKGVARTRGFLFTDCLMLCRWTGRRGLQRYSFETSYPITSLAVVNVRDLGSVKQAFKLLAFPDTRLFQCSGQAAKKEWLDKFDAAKRAQLSKKDLQEAQAKKTTTRDSEIEKNRPESASPSEKDDDSAGEITVLPDWLADVAEELDVLIVERHFEAAHDLAIKAETALRTEYEDVPQSGEISAKLAQRQKMLIDVLVKELQVTPEWTPRGGLQATRSPVRLLNKLKMESRACDLFLAVCSRLLKVHVKGVQLEGTTEAYVRQVSETFFCAVSDVIVEFRSLFPEEKLSALSVWASAELRILTNQMIKQIFVPQASLDSIARCVVGLRERCSLLKNFGVDLTFQLDGCLRQSIGRALKDYKERIVDSMKGKLVEDKWTPVNLETKAKVNKFADEMRQLGLILAKYVINDTWIDLSSSTIWFAKSVLTLQCEGLRMASEDMMTFLDENVHAVFNARLMLSIGNDSGYAQKNFKFILDTLLPLMLRKYEEEVGYENEKLLALANKFGIAMPKSSKKTATNVTKYSEEYF